MTLRRFLQYASYRSMAELRGQPPKDVHPVRWAGMLRWLESRLGEGESIGSVADGL